jgi:hypothetical protein
MFRIMSVNDMMANSAGCAFISRMRLTVQMSQQRFLPADHMQCVAVTWRHRTINALCRSEKISSIPRATNVMCYYGLRGFRGSLLCSQSPGKTTVQAS